MIDKGKVSGICMAFNYVDISFKSSEKFIDIFYPNYQEMQEYDLGGAFWFTSYRHGFTKTNNLSRAIALNLMYEMNRKPRNKRGKK